MTDFLVLADLCSNCITTGASMKSARGGVLEIPDQLPYPSARRKQSGIPASFRYPTRHRGRIMKNPLDSLWGTIISGLVLTVILYVFTANFLLK
jgi:hypothetical protein